MQRSRSVTTPTTFRLCSLSMTGTIPAFSSRMRLAACCAESDGTQHVGSFVITCLIRMITPPPGSLARLHVVGPTAYRPRQADVLGSARFQPRYSPRASRMPSKRLQCESGSAWSFYLRDLSDRATIPVDGWFAIAALPSCITDAGDRTFPVRLFAAASSLGCSLSARVRHAPLTMTPSSVALRRGQDQYSKICGKA